MYPDIYYGVGEREKGERENRLFTSLGRLAMLTNNLWREEERERSYLSLFGGRYGMGYSYRSGSLRSGLEWSVISVVQLALFILSHLHSTSR